MLAGGKGLVGRLLIYLRSYGLNGFFLFIAKALSILLARSPGRPLLKRSRLGGYILLIPYDRGISAELAR
jgi:hypothetical protein